MILVEMSFLTLWPKRILAKDLWSADRKLLYLVSYLCHLTLRKLFRIYHFSFFDWILITLILMRVKSASMIVDLFLSSLLTILTEMHFHPLIYSVFDAFNSFWNFKEVCHIFIDQKAFLMTIQVIFFFISYLKVEYISNESWWTQHFISVTSKVLPYTY